VCIGVLVLRVREPDRPRPFRVPFLWLVSLLGAGSCVFVMQGLPTSAWIAFAVWMAIGLTCYFLYGYKHSVLRNPGAARDVPPPLDH
jgi:APA family basic amino acid/polyamine antiporter